MTNQNFFPFSNSTPRFKLTFYCKQSVAREYSLLGHFASKMHKSGSIHWRMTALFHSPSAARCAIFLKPRNHLGQSQRTVLDWPSFCVGLHLLLTNEKGGVLQLADYFWLQIVVRSSCNVEISTVHISRVVNAWKTDGKRWWWWWGL